MATIHTLIDYDRQNPTAISREAYEDVGADAFSPGTFPRAFVDLEMWDAAADGNQLVLDTDYELVDIDPELSSANYEGETVYATLRIINVGYQTGFIYLTYGAVGTYPTALLHDPSGLPAAGALSGAEPIATVQSGEMVKTTPDAIVALVPPSAAVPAGMILPFGGTVAPAGYSACDGGELSRTGESDLFAAIGTTWGVGDGSTTFNKPPLNGAFLRGTGSHGSETMANGNPYAGPAVGAFEDDQMFGHRHVVAHGSSSSTAISDSDTSHPTRDGTAGGTTYRLASTSGEPNEGRTGLSSTDGTNGTPRVGDETRPFAAGILWCIKL